MPSLPSNPNATLQQADNVKIIDASREFSPQSTVDFSPRSFASPVDISLLGAQAIEDLNGGTSRLEAGGDITLPMSTQVEDGWSHTFYAVTAGATAIAASPGDTILAAAQVDFAAIGDSVTLIKSGTDWLAQLGGLASLS